MIRDAIRRAGLAAALRRRRHVARHRRRRDRRRVRRATQPAVQGPRAGVERRRLDAGHLHQRGHAAAERARDRALAGGVRDGRPGGPGLRGQADEPGLDARAAPAQARRGGARTGRSRPARGARDPAGQHGGEVRLREVLPAGPGLLPRRGPAQDRARDEPRLRRAAHRLARLARRRAAAARGLRAPRRARQRGRAARSASRTSAPCGASGYDMPRGRVREGGGAPLFAGRAALQGAALLRARQARRKVRRRPGAGRQAHPGAPARQHVGAAVGRGLRPARALPGRERPRRGLGARGTGLRRDEDDEVGRGLLRVDRLPDPAADVLGTLDAHPAAGPQGAVPRERLAHGPRRGRAHQAVHTPDLRGAAHHLPRARPRLLLPRRTGTSRSCSRTARTTASTRPWATPSTCR